QNYAVAVAVPVDAAVVVGDMDGAVGGDEVGGALDGAPHRVRRGTGPNGHAGLAIAEGGGAGAVSPAPVAQHHVPRRPATEVDAIAAVAGDDVGGAEGGAPHRVRRGASRETHAVGGVAEHGSAVDVGANAVAQHHVP